MKSLYDILSTFGDKYLTGKEMNKARIIQDIDRYDEELIMALLSEDLIKKHYAKKIGEYTIIETNKLIETFEMDDYWMDSYTKYTKKIGLTTNGRFLDESTDVILDFPYKDTVLKAGMSKEDVAKEDLVPNEPFFNEVIAAEEIDTLLDKKILMNAKRYTANTVEDANEFSEEDSLILKGNNLLALHSLKDMFAEKVKLIVIDPPYYFNKSKASDAFLYNSNFKLSTWLTFMSNRLEIAKDLLSDNGVIAIIIGEDGYAYLKLLADSVFDNTNYITTIVWRKTDNQSNIGEFANVKDYILLYRKTAEAKLGRLPLSEKAKKEYTYKDEVDQYRRSNIMDQTRGKHYYEVKTPNGETLTGPWMITKSEFDELSHSNSIHWPERGDQIPYGKTYLSNQLEKGQIPSDFWDASYGTNQRGSTEMKELFGERAFDFPKPEKLLMNLMSIGSDENDLVLDFFMGSATTQAVAMKMNRRFIGIEQMDYINTVSVPRLQKVMEGEQGGISKDINWQGGGSFVYAELMEKSKGYLQEVLQATDSDQLNAIYQLMLENVDLDFRADLESVQEMLKDTISLEDKKRLLIKVIDKNQLYYNYDEIDDTNVRELITDSDYAFNKSFYEEDGDGQKDS